MGADEVRGRGAARLQRQRHDVDAGHHRVARRALREAHDALEQLGEHPAARRTRGAGGQDRQDLVLAESPLDARHVGRKTDGAQDEPRGALEEPEDREESVVDDPEGDRCRQGRPLRTLDGDEFRYELAEEDMSERENGEGGRIDGDVPPVSGGRPRPRQERPDRGRPPSRARQSSRGPGWPA